MAPQEQPHREHRGRGREDVRGEEHGLPRMPRAGVRVRIGEEVLRDPVEDPARGGEAEPAADDPRLPSVHGGFPLRPAPTCGRAATRLAASVVAPAVRVAPETGRIPRLTDSSSSSDLPGNCSYQCSLGRNSSGSEKERTSMRAIVAAGDTTTIKVSARVRTTCVSKYAVPTTLPSLLATYAAASDDPFAEPESFATSSTSAPVRKMLLRSILAPGNASFSASSSVRQTFARAAPATRRQRGGIERARRVVFIGGVRGGIRDRRSTG